MFGRRKTEYSLYKPGLKRKDKIIKLTVYLLTALIIYEIVTGFLFFTVKIENNSMNPGLQAGDRILILKTAYDQNILDKSFIIPGFGDPQRGDIAVYRPQFSTDMPWYLIPLNSMVKFFTLQKKSISQPGAYTGNFMVKRILALPGDYLKIDSNVVHIKPEGGARFLTEFELTDNKYNVILPELPEHWNREENPFNTDISEQYLESSLYFIISDNRELYPDSRAISFIGAEQIQGKAVLRYWPLKRINVF